MKKTLISLLLVLLFLLAGCGAQSSEIAAENVKSDSGLLAPQEKISLSMEEFQNVMFIGDEQKLSVTGSDHLVWTSSDESVATVSENGTVTALAAGTVTVTAAYERDAVVNASAEITVGEHVDTLRITQSTLSLLLGSEKAEAELEVVVLPETALIQEVKMESSDPSVATVDENGVIRGVAPGTASIRVTSLDEAFQGDAVCEVTVKQGVSSITLSETAKELYVRERLALKANVLPEDAEDPSYTWTSSDESVATVDDKGNVTAVDMGKVTIKAIANDGSEVFGACELEVLIGVQRIAFEQNNLQLYVGAEEALKTAQIAYTLTPEKNSFPTLKWTSSDPSVATVDQNGNVKGVSAGRAVITGVSTEPKTAGRVKANCNVTVGNAVKSVSVEWGDNRIAKGSSRRLTATVSPKDAMTPKLKWSSSNEKVLTVDANGGIRAVGTGSAKITCETTDGTKIAQTREFKVYQAVVSLTPTERGTTVIFDGQNVTLHVTANPADATDKTVNWTSSDTSVATVDSTGKVTGKSAGNVKITATAKDGSNRSCTFQLVVEPEVPITIDSLGFGIYNANLLGITVKNNCAKTAIKNFDFTIALYSYDGSKLSTSGSYSLGTDETVNANSTRTIKRTLSGVAWAQKIVITITGVKLSDGSYYSIPILSQETWTFTRK